MLFLLVFSGFVLSACGDDRSAPIDAGSVDARIDAAPDVRAVPPPPPLGAGEWVKAFGTDMGAGEGRAVVTDAAGNVYVGGSIAGSADFGGGVITSMDAFDVVVVSYTAAGDFRWARHYPGTESQRVNAMAIDGDRIVVSGQFGGAVTFGTITRTAVGSDDAFVLMLDTDGTEQWLEVVASEGTESPVGIAFDEAGILYANFSFGDDFEFHGMRMDMGFVGNSFIASYERNGLLRDVHAFEFLFSGALIATSPGALHLAGAYNGNPSLGGEVVMSTGERDLYAFSLGRDYAFRWQTIGAGGNDAYPNAIATDALARTWIAGEFRDELRLGSLAVTAGPSPGDSFLARLGADGTPDLLVPVGGSGGQYLSAFDLESNRVYACGSFFDEIALDPMRALSRGTQDVFVASFDETLGVRWLRSFGGTFASGTGIAVGTGGDIFVTGTFSETLDFGGPTFTDEHDGAWYLMRLRE